MVEKGNSKSQLAKTQKITFNDTNLTTPRIKDNEAKKLIEDYQKIRVALKLVRRFSPLNPVVLILIKKRLSNLVQREFELYNSLPDLVQKEKKRSSTEIVASHLQKELNHVSQRVSDKLSELIKRKMLERKYMREVYTFKLPPINTRAKTKKFNSVFTSSTMKKKFS